MFAGAYAKLIGIGLIVAAALGLWWYVSSLKSEVETLTAQLIVCGTKLKDQNDAVAALKKESDDRLAAAAKELEDAKKLAEKNKSQAKVIYKVKPSNPNDLCKSALDLVNGGAK